MTVLMVVTVLESTWTDLLLVHVLQNAGQRGNRDGLDGFGGYGGFDHDGYPPP